MYTKEQLDKRVEAVMAEEYPPINLVQLYSGMGIDQNTFDKYYPIGSEDRNGILDRIAATKAKLARAKFYQLMDTEDTTAKLACIKILDNDMRKALSQQHTDITTNGQSVMISQEDKDKYKELFG